jgi:hypothetical protein
MKTYLVIASVLFAGVASADQHPTHPRFNPTPVARPAVRIQVLRATIQNGNLDPRNGLGISQIQGGLVEINHRRGGDVTLTLQPKFSCPAGRACAEVMPAPVQIRLPLVSVTRGECNTVVYTAKRDLRPVDGGLMQLQIVDNRANNCRTFVRVPATGITLSEIGPRASFNEERVSTFMATQLVNAIVDAPFPGDPAIIR